MRSAKSKCAVIVFAKEPIPGKVKTRLLTHYSPSQVTNLYKAFVKDVFGLVRLLNVDQRFIFYACESKSIPFLGKFKKDFILKKQIGADLGARMHNAFLYSQRKGFNKTVIIGTDCLTLTARDFYKTFENLDQYDVVLGPAYDGGYYLIGLKKPNKDFFMNMAWSVGSVLDETLKRIKKIKKTKYLLKKQHDVDTIHDLMKLKRHLSNRCDVIHTRRQLENINHDKKE